MIYGKYFFNAENRIRVGYGKFTNAVSSYILAVTHTGRLNGIQVRLQTK